jgi:hypothetical protein
MGEWQLHRKQQINYETMIQVLCMRAQPENITDPIKVSAKIDSEWGTTYDSKKRKSVWTFDFTIDKGSVFAIGNDELAGLYQDCDNVPMLVGLEEDTELPTMLSTSKTQKNIYFEVIDEEKMD